MFALSKISEADSLVLSSIHNQCFSKGWSEECFLKLIRDQYFFGFISEDIKSIKNGFILAKKVFEEIEIITFCVLENYRNTGIGKLLLNKLIVTSISSAFKSSGDQGKKYDFFLEVEENNFSAIHLYKSIGFCEISKRVGYYKEKNRKTDALVMRLQKYVS